MVALMTTINLVVLDTCENCLRPYVPDADGPILVAGRVHDAIRMKLLSMYLLRCINLGQTLVDTQVIETPIHLFRAKNAEVFERCERDGAESWYIDVKVFLVQSLVI